MESLYREAHQDTFRESPGSDTCTLKALKEVYDGKKEIKILDLGCSFGYHTICLARNINGQLIALDKNQACLDHLTKKAQELGMSNTYFKNSHG
ncbi:MAG: class I SAM-dependent methyltransferase, partial [Clostridiales bacterium]